MDFQRSIIIRTHILKFCNNYVVLGNRMLIGQFRSIYFIVLEKLSLFKNIILRFCEFTFLLWHLIIFYVEFIKLWEKHLMLFLVSTKLNFETIFFFLFILLNVVEKYQCGEYFTFCWFSAANLFLWRSLGLKKLHFFRIITYLIIVIYYFACQMD